MAALQDFGTYQGHRFGPRTEGNYGYYLDVVLPGYRWCVKNTRTSFQSFPRKNTWRSAYRLLGKAQGKRR